MVIHFELDGYFYYLVSGQRLTGRPVTSLTTALPQSPLFISV